MNSGIAHLPAVLGAYFGNINERKAAENLHQTSENSSGALMQSMMKKQDHIDTAQTSQVPPPPTAVLGNTVNTYA